MEKQKATRESFVINKSSTKGVEKDDWKVRLKKELKGKNFEEQQKIIRPK